MLAGTSIGRRPLKTWLFAVLEASLALVGLAAYFWANNPTVAATAAILAAIFGIAQPMMAARAEHKRQAWIDRNYDKSIDTIESESAELVEGSIEPPLPHRPSLLARFQNDSEQRPAWVSHYDEIVDHLNCSRQIEPQQLQSLDQHLGCPEVIDYLQGLLAYREQRFNQATQHFRSASEQNPAWVSPWLGWSAAMFRDGKFIQLANEHPHVNSVEMLPYDVGNETTFLAIAEHERDSLVNDFQEAAVALGNYYAAAQLEKSKQEVLEAQQEYRKVA